MSMISMIAAIDENWGIGKKDNLLCQLPADLKFFKQMTLGKPIIMGRKTFESIGRPLPGRLNIVLSRHKLFIEGVQVLSSLEEAYSFTSAEPEIMVIGGAHVYEQTIHLADQLFLTRIHHQFEADVFFPKLDSSIWQAQEIGRHTSDEKNAYDMTFYCYTRK